MKWLKDSIYHLKVETGWSYWYHLWHSIVNSWRLIKIAFKSVVHGLFPNVWKADAPIEVIKLYHEIMRIQHIQKMDELRKKPKDERYRD
jgi:hypothetical protein